MHQHRVPMTAGTEEWIRCENADSSRTLCFTVFSAYLLCSPRLLQHSLLVINAVTPKVIKHAPHVVDAVCGNVLRAGFVVEHFH